MSDEDKTKEQLLGELMELRRRNAELEASESERKRAEETLRGRAALDRVRVSVYEMRETADMQGVLISLYESLRDAGVVFDNCSVQIVDEEEGKFEGYSISTDRVELRISGRSLQDSAVYESWREKRPVYRRDLDEEDRYADRENIRKKRVRSVLDVPFSRGTVAINSVDADAFSESEIETLEQFAGVLSEAYTRFEDIRKIEESERSLRAERDRVQEYSERLEEMVEERTRELREAQEQLVRRERMALLGQLAGGVGHELRNPLGVIKNVAYYLKMVLEDPAPKVQEMLEILDKEVETSESIISTLLDFARGKAPVRREVDINDVVRAALSRVTVPEDVEVVSHLDAGLPVLSVDPEQLSQVFGNIVLNAVQAMSEGGQLTITTGAERPEWVAVSIADTGGGISAENREKLFEPLFTTKARGIGLGLALSRTLVEGHGGTIGVQIEEGRGSTFTVRLPF